MIFLAILSCHNRTFDSQSLSMIMKKMSVSVMIQYAQLLIYLKEDQIETFIFLYFLTARQDVEFTTFCHFAISSNVASES